MPTRLLGAIHATKAGQQGNYLHQSNRDASKKAARAFYGVVASITAEEVGHVEVVAATINAHLNQTPAEFITGGPGHLVTNSGGSPDRDTTCSTPATW